MNKPVDRGGAIRNTCGVCGTSKPIKEYCQYECHMLARPWKDGIKPIDVVAERIGWALSTKPKPYILVNQIDYIYKSASAEELLRTQP